MEQNTDTLQEISQRLEKIALMIEELLDKFFKTENAVQEDQQNEHTEN